MVSPGIPIRIGQDRSQTVCAGWYDGYWFLIGMREGEELKAPRHASAAATRDHTWYIPDTGNSSFMVAIYI